MKSSNTDASNPIAPKEMKELKRVFDQLCFFADKFQIMERLTKIRDSLAKHQNSNTHSTIQRASSKSSNSQTDAEGTSSSLTYSCKQLSMEAKEHESSIIELETEQTELNKALSDIYSRPAQHIRPQDTAAALKSLGKKATKNEVEDMMWEVDDKLDGVVDWEEFYLNYERNIRDKSGLEPASFHNMIQFMIYDLDNNGMVSIDETMNMLYARVGREQMEVIITKLFGGDDGTPIKEVGPQGGEINFLRYWEVVVREQQERFNQSDLGKVFSQKKQNKKRGDVKGT